MKFDFLVVGAGFYGCTFARAVADKGCSVLLIDKSHRIGGLARTTTFVDKVQLHCYGPHILNTDSKKVWDFLKRFGTINNYRYHPRACNNGKYYSFPVNKMTLQQIKVEEKKLNLSYVEKPSDNFETFLINKYGKKVYETFFYHYSHKMWGIEPRLLPVSIAKRVPVRLSLNDYYYTKAFEGIPQDGYSKLLEAMVETSNIKVGLETYYDQSLRSSARHVVYTGPIDHYYNYEFGPLHYRTLHIQYGRTTKDIGAISINYTDDRRESRQVCHNHWLSETVNSKVYHYTTETPTDSQDWEDCPMYPMRDIQFNSSKYSLYKELADKEKHVYFKGRLGEYVYRDMCPTVEDALAFSEQFY